MKTDAHAHTQLDADFGNGTPATLHIGFATTVPTPTAAGTEPSTNGYARIAVTNNATNFPAATTRQKKLATAVETAVATGGNIGKIYGLNFWDAATAGARKRFALLSDAFGFLATALASDVVAVPGHNLVVSDEVLVRAIPGATLPAALTDWAKYFVKTVSGNDITLSATDGGATIDLAAAGSFMIQRLRPKDWNEGDKLTFAANEIVFIEG